MALSRRAYILVVLLGASALRIFGQSTILSGEFWVELEPAVRFESLDTQTPEDQIRALLEEARFVFSAMVYGLEFRYVPLDVRREVEEEFEIELLAEIPWGDTRLRVVDSRYQNGRRYIHIRYTPDESQTSWLRFWDSNVHPVASAYGEGNIFHGQEQKLVAIREALKEAIRSYLRTREYNKPREISGLVAFSSVPYVIISSGTYQARVETKLDIRNVLPYKVY